MLSGIVSTVDCHKYLHDGRRMRRYKAPNVRIGEKICRHVRLRCSVIKSASERRRILEVLSENGDQILACLWPSNDRSPAQHYWGLKTEKVVVAYKISPII
jgi:hypothetical protein